MDKIEIFGFVENWKARNMEKHSEEQNKLGEAYKQIFLRTGHEVNLFNMLSDVLGTKWKSGLMRFSD